MATVGAEAPEVAVPAAPHADHDGASASGAEPPPGRASQRPSAPACPSPSESSPARSVSGGRGAEPTSGSDSEDSRGQGIGGRGADDDGSSGEESSPDEAAETGRSQAEPGGSQAGAQAEAAAEPVPKAALVARASQVFDTSASWPTEVRKPLLAPMVTKEVVRDVVNVANELVDRDKPALCAAFGNFDKRVAAGWLLTDVAGLPLLDRPQAVARGIKAQRAAAAAESAIKDARKRALAPARAAGVDERAAQDEAERAVLREDAGVIDAQQSPAATAAVGRASGSRKRARECAPSCEQQLAEAERALLSAQKAVRQADATAARQHEAMQHRLMKWERLRERIERSELPEGPPSKARTQAAHAMLELYERLGKAELAFTEARCEAAEAENEWLRAQLAERDAEMQLLVVEWGQSVQEFTSQAADW